MRYFTRQAAILLLLASAAILQAAPKATSPVKPGDIKPEAAAGQTLFPDALDWRVDLEQALAEASATYKPVVVFFDAEWCAWCRRTRSEVLTDTAVMEQLQHFVRVEIDIDRNQATAQRYMVRGVPAFRILSAGGDVRDGADGFVGAPQMLQLLRGALSAEFLKQQDLPFRELLAAIDGGKLEPEKWPEVMLALGDAAKRKEVRDRIIRLDPFPRKAVTGLLTHARLPVRLGALEILEELTGDNFGLDVWAANEQAKLQNLEAINRWRDWADAEGEKVESVFAVLDEAQISGYLRDLVSDNRERANRAARMIRHGGENAANSLRKFLDENADLPNAARRRMQEILYGMTLPLVGNQAPDTLARRLVFGNLDARLETLRELQSTGRKAIPVYLDFLRNEETLLRETAIESLFVAAGSSATPLVIEHLQTETDRDVIHAAIRGFGKNGDAKATEQLIAFLGHESENLVIGTLISLGEAKARGANVQKAILECLKDERWRVRAGALDAIEKIRDQSYSKHLVPLTRDEDDFVRFAAIKAIARLGDRSIAKDLEQLFMDHDDLKGPVVGALYRMNAPVSKAMMDELKEADPDVVLSVLGAMADSAGQGELELARRFAVHADLDIACAALGIIAKAGLGVVENQKIVMAALDTAEPAKHAAILENFQLDRNLLRAQRVRAQAGNRYPAASVSRLERVFQAFLGENTEDPVVVLGDLMKRVKRVFDRSQDSPVIRFHAAVSLVKGGNGSVLPFLMDEMDTFTVDQRMSLIYAASRASGTDVLPLVERLLRDPSSQVRAEAAETALDTERVEMLETVMGEVFRINATLKPWELADYEINGLVSQSKAKAALESWSRKLTERAQPALQTLGLVLAAHAKPSEIFELVEPFLDSPDANHRRAAFYALGVSNWGKFQDFARNVAGDPADKVRAVLPAVAGQGGTWYHYFDSEHFQRSSVRRTPPTGLREETLDALRLLADDTAPAVRLDASFVLLERGEKVDPGSLRETLRQIPDRSSLGYRIRSYLESNSNSLDESLAFLLDYVDERRISSHTLQEIRKKLNLSPKKGAELAFLSRNGAPAAASPPSNAAALPKIAPPAASMVKLLFFSNPGCGECERVEDLLDDIRSSFPRLQIDAQNIRKSHSAQLSEALAERFGVPEKQRLVTPAIFTRAGYLIKEEIDIIRLGELLQRAASSRGDDSWAKLDAAELATAGAAISQRFASVNLGVIAGAGLIDGVNPCAFATIILFLSYLQIARRGKREMLVVGLAFILGVFVTYFLLGLGLVEAVTRLQVLQTFSTVLTWMLAAFVLVIMVLNLRDGILCLQGRLQETTLQLPGIIKDRVREIVRTGARHRRFVIAAFVSGVIISVLELACTGQVYAPTIYYMVQAGSGLAVWYLLLYNIAFVLPLGIIFILAMFGLRSEALIEFQKNRTALVKFATAALFLVLFVVLIWTA